MAEIIKAIRKPHPCRDEIAGIDSDDLMPGTTVRCSCGKQFIKRDSQRDGMYWSDVDDRSA